MLKFENLTLFVADLGEENPLADIKNINYIHAGYKMSESAKEHRLEHLGEGMIDSMLPYLQQDNYNRLLKRKTFKAAILENSKLKAIFLPELGGRLWSLYDKHSRRELLYKNDKIFFGNLSLRNAWFCGGVEWNVSIKGHNPLTCSPMFAAILEKNGETGLRLYEFERKREIVYSLDVWLPQEKDYLLVHPRIENLDDKDKYMYWWSNIAVPQVENMRVCAPAKNAFVSMYENGGYFLDYCSMPYYKNTEVTFPSTFTRCYDVFFVTEDKSPKYIFASDESGYGLLEFSEKLMKGRKLFAWGKGNGGKNWNEFLTNKGNAYIEIQAGLAETQLQHLVMKKNSVWEWTEAFCALDIGGVCKEYDAFRVDTERAIARKIPIDTDEELRCTYSRYADALTKTTECFGSGWGVLKNLERSIFGKGKISNYCDFPESTLGVLQEPFKNLIQTGVFSENNVDEKPKAYCTTDFMLEKADLAVKKYPNWNALYHYGVILYEHGRIEEAKAAWENSAFLKPNAWAYRNLAMLYRNEYCEKENALMYMKMSISLKKDCISLWRDFAETFLKYKLYDDWLIEAENIPAVIAANGRLRLYKALCLVRTGRAEQAAEIVNYNFKMDDIKEGEISVSSIWYEIYGTLLAKKYNLTDKREINELVDKEIPLKDLDFRMH